MENNLSKWFDAAKRVEPYMSIEEVEAMISQTPKGGFSTLQKTIFMSTIVLVVTAWVYWLLNSSSSEKFQTPQHVEVQSVHETPVQKTEPEQLPQQQFSKPQHQNQPVLYGVDSASYLDEEPYPLNQSISTTEKPHDGLFFQNDIVFLEPKELEALGVKIEKGLYNYYYKTYPYQEAIKATQLRSSNDSFYFAVGHPGKNYFIKPWEDSFHPLYLTDSAGNNQRNFHFQDKPTNQSNLVFEDSLRNLFLSTHQRLIPVGIRTPDQGRLEILWYTPTKDFINVLPKRYAGMIDGSTGSVGAMSGTETGEFNDGRIYLNYEELAQLGIVTDGETLFYGNITGEVSKIANSPSHFSTPYFSLKISEYGGQRLLYNNISADSIVQRSKPFWPAVVEVIKQKKRDTSIVVTEQVLQKSRELDYFKELKSVLIPVVVHTQSQPSKYSDDLELIFWFKPEDPFFAALPASLSTEVKAAYPPATLEKVKVVNAGFFTQRKGVTYPKGFDSVRVNQLNKKIIELTPAEYKKLNIKQTQTGFVYKNNIELYGKVHDLKVEQKEFRTDVAYDNYSFLPKRVSRRDKPFAPVVLTDMSFQRVTYFYMYPDSVTYEKSRSINEGRFEAEVDKLVPIKVSNTFILWFPLSPELVEALPERYRNQFDNASTPSK